MSSISVDPSMTYFTEGKVLQMGRAVVVCLKDADLPGTCENHHMTILFRKNPDWSEQEVSSISTKAQDWIRTKYGEVEKCSVPFSVSQWGKRSVKILGDLCELCDYLRIEFASLSSDKQRIPHCALVEERGRHGSGRHGVREGRRCGRGVREGGRRGRGGRCGRGGRRGVCASVASAESSQPECPGRAKPNKNNSDNNNHRCQNKMKAKLERRLSKVERMEQKRLAQAERLGFRSKQLRQKLKECCDDSQNETSKTNRRQMAKLQGLIKRLPLLISSSDNDSGSSGKQCLQLFIDGGALTRPLKCRYNRKQHVVLSKIHSVVSNYQSSCELKVTLWFLASEWYTITATTIEKLQQPQSDSSLSGGQCIEAMIRDQVSEPTENVVLVTNKPNLAVQIRNALGVKVMRSRVFFRTYIKQREANGKKSRCNGRRNRHCNHQEETEEKDDGEFIKVSDPGFDDDDNSSDEETQDTAQEDQDEDHFTTVGNDVNLE